MNVDLLEAIRTNLLAPPALFFALGIVAALARSDLKFPESLYTAMTIYLLVAIGFKGGVSVHEAGLGVVWRCPCTQRSCVWSMRLRPGPVS